MNTGFDIKADTDNMEFIYGKDVFGPITEKRKLDDIRQSLSDPNVDGPEYVYAVAMDVGKEKDKEFFTWYEAEAWNRHGAGWRA